MNGRNQAMQYFILGCVVFLALVELGVEQKTAGNAWLLLWVAGAIVWFVPHVEDLYERFRGDAHAQ